MKTLGALSLPDGGDRGTIEWTDRQAYQPVAGQASRTLGGGLVVYSQALSKGRPITLEARESVCWLSQAEVDAINAMAGQAGATFQLEWDGETHTVMFRHHEPPAAEFTPIWPHHDLYVGTIKLITV